MSSKRKLTPKEEARLAQVRENFQKRKEITSGLSQIKNTIGVYSGKGGVGKTTVAVNLACSLASMNKSVGIFDVDIDCPNVANILHLSEGPTQNEKDGKFYLDGSSYEYQDLPKYVMKLFEPHRDKILNHKNFKD